MYSGTMHVVEKAVSVPADTRVWVRLGNSGTWGEYNGLTIEQAVIEFAKQFGIHDGKVQAKWNSEAGEHVGEFNVSSREVWEVQGLRGGAA